jgi:hypothetical protein
MTSRRGAGVDTYRYQNAANFSNISPLPWMGEYRAQQRTTFEMETSRTMQDYLFAFISDPVNGLKAKGWAPYDHAAAQGGIIVRFGADGKAAQNVSGDAIDGVCFELGTYDSSP